MNSFDFRLCGKKKKVLYEDMTKDYKELRPRRTILALLLIKFMKYRLVQMLLYEYLEENPNSVYIPNICCLWLIWMNNRHLQLFNFLILLRIAFFAHLLLSIFLYPHPSIQKLMLYKESSYNVLNVCYNKNWIGGWGVC